MNSCDQEQALVGSLVPRVLQAGMIVVATVLMGVGCHKAIPSGQSPNAGRAEESIDPAGATTGEEPSSGGDEEIGLPEQVTRPLTEKDVPAVIKQAIRTNDVLLADRIAWCSKNEAAVKKAEDFLAKRREAFLNKFQTKAQGGGATVRPGGLIAGAISQPHSGHGSRFKIGRSGELPEGVHVVYGPTRITQHTYEHRFQVEYAVIIGDAVPPGSLELSFEILLLKADDNAGKAVGKAPVKLKATVREGPITADAIQDLYAVISWHCRRSGELNAQSGRALDEAGDLVERNLVAAQQKMDVGRELGAKAQEHTDRMRVYIAWLDALEASQDASTAAKARAYREVVSKKCREWRWAAVVRGLK